MPSLPRTNDGRRAPRTAATMRAAQLAGDGQVDFVEVPVPDPGPGEVRVRLEGCGVCASTQPLSEGRAWFDYPRAPGEGGHEGFGIVDALGADVTDLALGDRVAVLSERAFAEHDVAARERITPIPAALAGHPVPAEPLGCAMNVMRRAAVRPGETVAVVGLGFLGLLCVQLAARSGAQVLAISRRPYALDVASRYGAEPLPADDPAVAERVRERTAGRGATCVIEATGLQAPLDLATDLSAEGGRLIIAGYHQDGPRTVDMQVWNWRGLDVINAHERDPRVCVDGMRAALEAVAGGRLDPFPLITHEIPFDDLPRAFELMARRPAGFLKAWVRIAGS